MLFDLQGKRRRVVQATYLTLAVLMGGGLVLFGIGGDVSGRPLRRLRASDGGGSGNSAIEKRIERNEERAAAPTRAARPRCKELVRDYYQLATAPDLRARHGFPDEAKDELRKAAANWQRYLELEPEKPDASLATVALQVYDPTR